MGHLRPASSTAAAGSVPDFDTFFAVEYRRLFEVLYLLTRDRADAEDLAQEAMARAYERWSGSATPPAMCTAPPSTSTAHCDDAWRSRSVSGPSCCRLLTSRTRSSGAWTALAALALLPTTQRAAVVLVDWAGMTAEEAARVLGIQPVSVRGRLHRARAALRQRIGDVNG